MVKYNDNKYFIFKVENIDWATNNGFSPRKSKDGLWFIGDRGLDKSDIDVDKKTSILPSYTTQEVVDFYEQNGYLDHKHALLLVDSDSWKHEVL